MGEQPIPARVDAWLVAGVTLLLATVVAIALTLFGSDAVTPGVRIVIAVLALGMVLATLAVTVPVRYAFEDGGVFVRAGLLRLRLAYPDIVLAQKRFSPVSGAAWSWSKVRLVLRQGGLIEIAPRDRDAFLAELARRAPHLRPSPRGLEDPGH
jgi:hypothetical protein